MSAKVYCPICGGEAPGGYKQCEVRLEAKGGCSWGASAYVYCYRVKPTDAHGAFAAQQRRYTVPLPGAPIEMPSPPSRLTSFAGTFAMTVALWFAAAGAGQPFALIPVLLVALALVEPVRWLSAKPWTAEARLLRRVQRAERDARLTTLRFVAERREAEALALLNRYLESEP